MPVDLLLDIWGDGPGGMLARALLTAVTTLLLILTRHPC
jgi:hypothetical protein